MFHTCLSPIKNIVAAASDVGQGTGARAVCHYVVEMELRWRRRRR